MQPPPGRDRYRWAVFVTVALGVYAWVVDNAAVNIALPSIGAHFSASLPTVQWVVLTYLLAITALLLPLGRAADVLGRKRLYVAGFAVYSAGALMAAGAQSMPWLLVGRVVQAVGSAAVQGNGQAIALGVFPPQERGKVLGLNALVVAIAATTGPIFGGLLVDAFGWRSVLVLTGVLGLVALGLATFVLREDRISTGLVRGLDWPGMGASAVAVIALFLMLSQGHSAGWTSSFTLTVAAVAAVGLAAFVAIELRAPQPMIDLRLFGVRKFSLGTSSTYLTFVAVTGNTYVLPFYLQGILGLRASTAGLLTTPFAIMLGLVAPLAGRVSDRIGSRVLTVLGSAVVCGGAVAMSRLDASSSTVHVVAATMALGAGMGTFSPPNGSAILGSVERERYGVVSGFMNLTRNMGQVSGVAVTTLVITMAITSLGAAPDIGALRKAGATVDPLVARGFVDGMRQTYLVSAGLVALVVLLSAVPYQRHGAERAAAQPQPQAARPEGEGAP